MTPEEVTTLVSFLTGGLLVGFIAHGLDVVVGFIKKE